MKRITQLLIKSSGGAVGLLLAAGCAHFTKNSLTRHELVAYGAAVPPDWCVVLPVHPGALPGAGTNGCAAFACAAETNTVTGFWAPRPRIFVAWRESWTDRSRGGGTFLFTDPAASQMQSAVTNQSALGGAHTFSVGTVGSAITTNAVAALTTVGSSVGSIVGTAVSAATGGATAVAGSAAASTVKAASATPALTATNLP